MQPVGTGMDLPELEGLIVESCAAFSSTLYFHGLLNCEDCYICSASCVETNHQLHC